MFQNAFRNNFGCDSGISRWIGLFDLLAWDLKNFLFVSLLIYMNRQHLFSLHYIVWPLLYLVCRSTQVILKLCTLINWLQILFEVQRMNLIWQNLIASAVYFKVLGGSDQIDFYIFVFDVAIGTGGVIISF